MMTLNNFDTNDKADGLEMIEFPTKEEIQAVNNTFNLYADTDNVIPTAYWNGSCYKDLLENICTEIANEYGEDPWDVFAGLIKNMYGEEKIEVKNIGGVLYAK